MSQLFYKYIVDELLVDYFKKEKIQSGSRYYIIIDNEQHRNSFLDAIKSSFYSRQFQISHIYSGVEYLCSDDVYSTFVFEASKESLPLILGDSTNATDDYLTTLRNAVGNSATPYANYGILYVLSSSRLESLTTTCINLQADGLPLNCDSIKKSLDTKINEFIVNDYERLYLRDYLERLSDKIGDGSYSLFDYKDILSILSKRTLRGSFQSLEYFKDDEIYTMLPLDNDSEFKKRIELNADCYSKISNVFTHLDGNDRIPSLSKLLDDKFSEKIAKYSDVNDISFDEILQSIQKKEASSVIAFEDCLLNVPKNGTVDFIKRIQGNQNKKSSIYIIIGDTTNAKELPLKLVFKSDIYDCASLGKVYGRNLHLDIPYGLTYVEVGKDNNIHKFFIKRIKTNVAFFNGIKQFFKLLKKGTITVDVPDDIQELSIGYGAHNVEMSLVEKIEWKDDYVMQIPLDSSDDKINFHLLFDGMDENFEFKFSNNRLVPKSPIKIFELIWTKKICLHDSEKNTFGGRPFSKVYYEEDEFCVHDFFRDFLCLEKQMITQKALALTHGKKNQYYAKFVDIPEKISKSLMDIYDYFIENDTVPSLCYIDDELANLYSIYLQNIYVTLNSIPENRTLHSFELGLTNLGIVEEGDNISMSPFHPLLVAYMLEFKEQFDNQTLHNNIWKLISPFYLVPYLFYNNKAMRPYANSFTESIKTWLFYENVNSKDQVKTYDITSKMVNSKMTSFIKHFNYLFQDINSPIIISTVGISDDTYVVKGIVEFIKSQYAKGGVQRIEIHEYVDDLLVETYFEKLNRINSDDLIVAELKNIGEDIEKKDLYTSREIIRQLFTRVSFYKHCLAECDNHIEYSHIAFYMMNPICDYVTPPAGDMRVELSLNGLISIPSTLNNGHDYNIGFGSKGLKMDGIIYQLVASVNNLYANARNNGHNQFQKNICVAKTFAYNSYDLLDSLYANANWVTFLNPEVDIDFFYRQKGVYVVHYTDQYTINAKYDSITVTKHVDQYENMLRMAYERYTRGNVNVERFNKTMKDYFNSLNGSWLLGIINKTESQIREKLSIVAASIVMRHFLARMPQAFWIPISLEEILRVSGSIGLPKDESIFSAKLLGQNGALSDDLLMMGLDVHEPGSVKLLLYPVEVKIAKTGAHTDKGEKQVAHTYRVLKEFLVEGDGFINKIYRTFFASQYLTNAEKLYANNLMSDTDFELINSYRFNLLNLGYKMSMDMSTLSVGHAALVYFYTNVVEEMSTEYYEDVPICNIKLTQKHCFECVADPEHKLAKFLSSKEIYVSQDTLSKMKEECGDTTENMDSSMQNMSETDRKESDGQNEVVVPDETLTNKEEELKPDMNVVQQKNKNLPIQIKIGTSNSSGEEIIFEPNNTDMVTHPNLGIIGTMGTGKTQLARSIIAQFAKEKCHNVGGRPVGLLVFDYKGDYKDKDFLEMVDGECFKYKYPFNPLKLVITDEVNGMNLPAITADRISDSFAKAYGLGTVQQSSIKQIIIETYNDFGITRDPDTWNKPVPTMDNVIEKYFETYDANDKAYALFDKLNDYTIFNPDNNGCVSLFEWLDGVKVIDLTLYPDDTKKVIVALILDLFYAEMKQLGDSKYENGLREIRSMIMVDEAHQFMKQDFNSLRSIISEGRMFGVGMILSTQNLEDFKSKAQDYTSFILSWVIHHVNNAKTGDIANIFGSSDPNIVKYQECITSAGKFQSLCKIGGNVRTIRDLPYFELIKSDSRFVEE